MTVLKKILLAGAAHLDRTGRLDAPSALGCSNPGTFEESVGGTCLNVAGVLASLGLAPQLVSQTGRDSAASLIQKDAESRGIRFEGFVVGDHNTGTYTSILEPDGNLLIALADMGIYETIETAMIDHVKEQASRNDILCLDANLPELALAKLSNVDAPMKVAFTVSKIKAKRLHPILPNLDFLFTNRIEAASLFSLSDDFETFALLEALFKSSLQQAVISDGANSVMVFENGNLQKVPVQPVSNLMDVTGAGDGLAGGTLYSLAKGNSLIDAVQFGIRVAREIVQVSGPWYPGLDRLLTPLQTSESPE